MIDPALVARDCVMHGQETHPVCLECERRILIARLAAVERENQANYSAYRLEHECRNAERDAAQAERDSYKADRDAHQKDAINRGLENARLRAALERAREVMLSAGAEHIECDASCATGVYWRDEIAALDAARREGSG